VFLVHVACDKMDSKKLYLDLYCALNFNIARRQANFFAEFARIT